ncbi:TonB-dependent receptor [Phenylobacterium conjunctum]|uniref:TonB-dependent receptor n=1 Tax=Phenylobacterium conjunctum TaxID=1298959 RepID=A0ABW3T1H8_9CAUL
MNRLFAQASPRALAAAAALLALPAAAHAAEAEVSTDVSELIVVGQGDRPITVQPRGLSVSLGQTEFEAINAINVEDLMKYAPNFFVRKRFAGDDNAVVALRGANTVQSARTLVLVDGFVVSNFLGNRYDYPPKWNVVGPAEVRQFDIVYGPYSARYGGNSMGGVISVTTRAPEGREVYASAQTMIMPFKEYGFDETFKGYSAEGGLAYKQDGGPWSVRAGFRHFDNVGQSMTYNLLSPTTGTGVAVTGAYDDKRLATPVFGAASPVHVLQDQLRVRVGYAADNGWTFEGMGFAWLTNQDLTDTRSFLKDAAGKPIHQGKVTYGGKTWNATGLTLSETKRTEYLAGVRAAGPLAGWDASLNVSRYWIAKQDARSSKDYLTGAANGAGTQTLSRTPGWLTADGGLERRLGDHKLAFGFNANRYETDQDVYNTTAWKGAAGKTYSASTYGKTSLWGLWIEDVVSLGDWRLTGGVRYDKWRAFDGGIGKLLANARVDSAYPEREDSSVSPKLSLQGPLPGDWDLQVSVGSAVRFPTVGELFQGKLDDVTRQIDPQSFDPNLKPEKSRDISVILRRSFGPVRTTTSVFWQDIDDAVFSFQGLNQYGNVVSSYKNIDEVRQYGVELILEATDILIDGLDVDANVSWMNAETIKNAAATAAEGKMFPRIPEWRSNGNIRYRINDAWKASLGWRYATRPNSDLFGLSRGDAYGFQSEYFTVDGRVTWAITPKAQLGLGIDNLFNDQAYVAHPLPQRTLVVDIKSRW